MLCCAIGPSIPDDVVTADETRQTGRQREQNMSLPPDCIPTSADTIRALGALDHTSCSSPAASTAPNPPGIHTNACWVLCCRCAHENPALNLNCASCRHTLCRECGVYYQALSAFSPPQSDFSSSAAASALAISSAIRMDACWVLCCRCAHENPARNLDCAACLHSLCRGCWVYYKDDNSSRWPVASLSLPHDGLASAAAPGIAISSAIHTHTCWVLCCWCGHANPARELDCRACPHSLCPVCYVFYVDGDIPLQLRSWDA